MPIDGTGYCSICTPSDDNKKCTSYVEINIKIRIIDVHEKEK